MSSRGDSDWTLNLERDLPVTPADLTALRRARHETPSWLPLEWSELDALLPPGVAERALDRRPVARADWRPFSLVEDAEGAEHAERAE